MRSFSKEGYCNVQELEDILDECLEVVHLANNIKKGDFQTFIEIRDLNIKYNHGEYKVDISYINKLKDDTQRTPNQSA